ncbi:helix-turn-helix domain-containing protein [Bacillus benzoevorans]|uniref:DNA-binding XRE family transcriptional regulator n=1 Tax=Bacillus benzoevorans TaxID=1456 RepID=A0A7X0HXF6_9BACI|nr:helix-turn-helix domain-containing protein [Bacillus benzoevorans]MBB6447381.1 DNA-binding XRE family transcriptional regulator [Bacillus benzoevorans]
MNPQLFKLMRQAAGYSQSGLAAAIGVSPTLICLTEKGEKRISKRVEKGFREIVEVTEEREILAGMLLKNKA